MIWREKRLLLVILGLLLLANTLFFFTYRVQYEKRLSGLDARLEEVKAQHQETVRTRVAAEQQVAAYGTIQKDVQRVYETSWATEEERLTALIGEVQQLAARVDMTPRTISFQRQASSSASRKDAGVGATEVGISFSVEGTYQQVRRLINLLELSDQFLIIDQINLSSADGERLTLNLLLKTLFRETAPAPERRAANRNL